MSTDNTDKTKGPKRASSPAARKGYVLVDYCGSVGRAVQTKGALRDQKPVAHRLSPLCAYWPENGTPWMVIQPGLNLVDAQLWATYTETVNDGKGAPQVMDKIAREQLVVLTDLPKRQRELDDLISRTLDHDALRWIEARETEGADRPEVITAIHDRLAKARPIQTRRNTFQGQLPNLKNANDPQPSLAMG